MNTPQFNTEPWLLPTAVRYGAFCDAKKQNKKCALYIYDQADTSTFRYRAYNVMQYTTQSERWCAQYFFARTERDEIMRLIPECDLLIIVRLRWTHFTEEIITRAHLLGKKVLFDADDLIFDTNYLGLVTNTLNTDFRDIASSEIHYDFWFAMIGRTQLTASKTDGFITTNPYLGQKFTEKFGKPYSIIRNTLNKEQLEASEWFSSQRTRSKDAPFTIGYFSGTPSHINDFLMVAPELKNFLIDHPNSHLKVVGFMDFPEFMQDLLTNGRISFIPLVDFIELQRLTADVDVSIVPLVVNDFTNCKSELKYFEAAIVNTLTIASPNYTYTHAIKHGETGFLCQPGEWYDTLKKIYRNEVDCASIIKNARKHALETYSGSFVLHEIENTFDFFYDA